MAICIEYLKNQRFAKKGKQEKSNQGSSGTLPILSKKCASQVGKKVRDKNVSKYVRAAPRKRRHKKDKQAIKTGKSVLALYFAL